ncbi:hypothetical protein B9Z19DRAFT_730164 [Tuber borchii]|uniref:Uncharacterized protein n=1 Tax=Tuber borchii TaxID=42251 RepID=A0A2T6ZY57_TUBBO|nr:hypothetical protein B9Z19DRAFT_730164 [Tuber borchii]
MKSNGRAMGRAFNRHTRAPRGVEFSSVQSSNSTPVNPKVSRRETKVAECEMKCVLAAGEAYDEDHSPSLLCNSDHSAGQVRSIYHPTNQPHPNLIVNARQLTRSIPHKQAFLTPFTPLPPTRASILLAHTQPTAASAKRIQGSLLFPPSNTDVGWVVFFFFFFSSSYFPPPFSYHTYLLRSWNPPPLSSYSNSCSR